VSTLQRMNGKKNSGEELGFPFSQGRDEAPGNASISAYARDWQSAPKKSGSKPALISIIEPNALTRVVQPRMVLGSCFPAGV
jgi:hypothetical protein